jgi:hypothetical protein
MAGFNWPDFLTQHNIPFTTQGTARNDIECQCPLCGSADTGHNLSISLIDKGWYCWRQPDSHRGRAPHRLIQALIGCSYLDAEALVRNPTGFLPNDGDFIDRLTALFTVTKPSTTHFRYALKIPAEFREIEDIGKGRMFVSYLEKRGFAYADIPALVTEFRLRYCVSDSFLRGAFRNRLIFLIEIDRELASWTGRHIGSSRLRYNSLSPEDETLPAKLSVKDTILWYDRLRQINGGTLAVCEGPFDALKMNYLGNRRGIYATCVYGLSVSDKQLDLIESLAQFKTRYLILDRKALLLYYTNVDGRIGFLEDRLGFKVKILPESIKDPGEFNESTFSGVFGS